MLCLYSPVNIFGIFAKSKKLLFQDHVMCQQYEELSVFVYIILFLIAKEFISIIFKLSV